MEVKRKEINNTPYILESLYNVCAWWIETYPEDVFVSNPLEIVEIRKQAKKILDKRRGKS